MGEKMMLDGARVYGGRAETPVEVIHVLGAPLGRPHSDRRVDAFAEGDKGQERRVTEWLRDGEAHRARLGLDAPASLGGASPNEVKALAPGVAASHDARETESLDEADALALRIQVAGRGEISEQAYGPARRWALLDADGGCAEVLEAESETARRLVAEGRLRLDRFERGAAVYRLSLETEPAARAAYRAHREAAGS